MGLVDSFGDGAVRLRLSMFYVSELRGDLGRRAQIEGISVRADKSPALSVVPDS